MSWLRGLALGVAGIAIGCSTRSLDANDDAGHVSVGIDGGAAPDGAGDGAPGLRDAIAIEVIEPRRCGDGIVDPPESCDDGNQANGDGCNAICQIECGVSCSCTTPGACVISHVCGDGLLGPNEACDDGNAASGDGCASDCASIVPGWRCPALGRPCVPICGDGRVVGPETCDDGDVIAGDGCSDICVTEPTTSRCGDGVISGAEECDDGTNNSGTMYGGCTTRCRYGPFCGDGVRNGLEECDRGAADNTTLYGETSGCAPGCTFPHFCGDGIVDEPEGEQCDLGPNNGGPGQTCTTGCRIVLN